MSTLCSPDNHVILRKFSLDAGFLISMRKINIDQDWLFYLGDHPLWHDLDVNNNDWEHIDLPHDWSIGKVRDPGQPCGAAGGYFPNGRGWYWKTLDMNMNWLPCEVKTYPDALRVWGVSKTMYVKLMTI